MGATITEKILAAHSGHEVVVPGQGDEALVTVGGELAAYPNPYRADRTAAAGVTITGLEPGDRVTVLDAVGREISRLDAGNDGQAFLDVRAGAGLPSGVYLLEVEGPAGRRRLVLAVER